MNFRKFILPVLGVARLKGQVLVAEHSNDAGEKW